MASDLKTRSPVIQRDFFKIIQDIMIEKKQDKHESPDITRLKEVVIDHRTRIYIQPGADIEEAKFRYRNRLTAKKLR